MSRPIVGITSRHIENEYKIKYVASPKPYIRALVKAGAAPVIVPLGADVKTLKTLAGALDGILFSGGGDIETRLYNGEEHPKVYGVDKDRDRMELALVQLALENKVPLMGICRGFQVINVALGGSLYSHINDQLPGAIEHRYFPDYPFDHIAHTVSLNDPSSKLAGIVEDLQLEVNSLHHQGVKKVGANLKVTASAPDGLVEAFEYADNPFGVAVQWHPEWLGKDEASEKLFKSFVKAAAKYSESRE